MSKRATHYVSVHRTTKEVGYLPHCKQASWLYGTDIWGQVTCKACLRKKPKKKPKSDPAGGSADL